MNFSLEYSFKLPAFAFKVEVMLQEISIDYFSGVVDKHIGMYLHIHKSLRTKNVDMIPLEMGSHLALLFFFTVAGNSMFSNSKGRGLPKPLWLLINWRD